MTEPERIARARFLALSLLRAGGVVVMVIGLWLWMGGHSAGATRAGVVLFALGAVDAIAVPALLARRWRSQE